MPPHLPIPGHSVGQYGQPAARLELTPCEGRFDTGIVRAVGEFDLANAGQLNAILAEIEDCARQVLDLREVVFLDCVALKVIWRASDRADARGARLVIISGPPQLGCLFEATGAGAALDVVSLGRFEPAGRALLLSTQRAVPRAPVRSNPPSAMLPERCSG